MSNTPETKPKKSRKTGPKSSWKLTPETVAKLKMAFAIDASIEEACSYADISRETFYRWQKENKELYDEFERLRQKPVLKARQVAISKLDESYSNAMDYLKRKRRGEFGDSVETDNRTLVIIMPPEIIHKHELTPSAEPDSQEYAQISGS